MANAARQEVTFTFDGKDYEVRPTFDVISGIESATGMSCIALANKCYPSGADAMPSLTVIAAAVFQLLRSFNGPNAARVGEVLMDDGMSGVLSPLGSILQRALMGNKEHLRMAEEEARKAEGARAAAAAGDPPKEGE